MSMKITLLSPSGTRPCKAPYEGADHVAAEGACPQCKANPFKVAGNGMRPSADDRAWEADATCWACRKHVGTLRVDTGTLFGVREDRAVLEGRCRVY